MSSRANIVNLVEDQKITPNGALNTLPCNKTAMDTPSNLIYAGDDEKRNLTRWLFQWLKLLQQHQFLC
jgi:hypothetical protein